MDSLFDTLPFSVPRETQDKISLYTEGLRLWGRRINLIGKNTFEQIEKRHILDSLQLIPFVRLSKKNRIYDLGTGAGLPGLLLAPLLVDRQIYLVDSDQKKISFCTEMRRVMNLDNVEVLNSRIPQCFEKQDTETQPLILSRALSPLSQILMWCVPYLHENAEYILMKGANVHTEIDAARENFCFDLDLYPSLVDHNSWILRLTHVRQK